MLDLGAKDILHRLLPEFFSFFCGCQHYQSHSREKEQDLSNQLLSTVNEREI